MKIVVLGAGVQGTIYGVRLARAGHDVTLIARGQRAQRLRSAPATLEDALTGVVACAQLPVQEELDADLQADLCLVTVRCEQLHAVLPVLSGARQVARFLFLVNKADSWQPVFSALGRDRTVLGFPGTSGSITGDGVVRYVDVKQQPTAIEATAPELARLLRRAGFPVEQVRDMPAWLIRHALFVTAVCGALYEVDCDTAQLAADRERVRYLVQAVRSGLQALDRHRIGPEPLALRAIFRWVPLPLATRYWQGLLASPQAAHYFAGHARHAPIEMAMLAAELRQQITQQEAPGLHRLFAAVDAAAATAPA